MNTRITVTKASGGDFVLCDPDGAGTVSQIILQTPTNEPSSDYQIVKYFRSEEIVMIDRGQVQTVWNFTLVKEWPDLASAIAWHEDVRNNCPRLGTVQKTEKDFKGGQVNRWLKDAGIVIKSLPRSGVATFTQVSIIGGKILTAKPV